MANAIQRTNILLFYNLMYEKYVYNFHLLGYKRLYTEQGKDGKKKPRRVAL